MNTEIMMNTEILIGYHSLVEKKDLANFYNYKEKTYIHDRLSLKLNTLKEALREENLSKDKK
jgi:hypothetical protein